MRCQYKAYYFESFPIKELMFLDFTHMHVDGIKTGGMKKEAFLSLTDSIRSEGLINPIIVEVDSGPRFRIAMGNNRAEVVKQLGEDFIKALVFFNCTQPTPELGECTHIFDTDLEAFMEEKHPGDETWKKSAWADRLLKFVASRQQDKPWLVAY
jgi:hypothetical protein